MKLIKALAAVLLLAGCAPMSAPAPAPSTTGPTPTAESCVGGRLEKHGKAQATYCVRPAADAGKICSDKSDCLGVCLAPEAAEAGHPVRGRCQMSDGPMFGCYTYLEAGKAITICRD